MIQSEVQATTAHSTVKTKSQRKKLYALHTWVGFHLAAIMSLVLFTGTFAVISNEIDWLIQKDMRVSPGEQKVSWSTMENALRRHSPGDAIVSIYSMKSDYFAYRARMIDEYGRNYFLHINQWTGEVTGSSSPLVVQRFFRDIHRYMFMPNVIGLPLVTSMAFILLISLYTGLKTTRKWRTAATRIRFEKGVRVAIGDGHKAFGLWSSWFIILMIITGIWYLFEFGAALTKNRLEPPRATLSAERIQAAGTVLNDLGLDEVVAAAKKAYPELDPRVVYFPFNVKAGFEVHGRNNNIFIRDRANKVYVDPVDGSILKVQKASDISLVAFINELADPLHFGYFGGLPVKIIWFVFGLMLTALSVSGVWLTWKRLRTMSISKVQIATMPILIVMIAFGFVWYQRVTGPTPPNLEIEFAEHTIQGLKAKLVVALDKAGQPTGTLRLLISSDHGRPNLKQVIFFGEKQEELASKKLSRLDRRIEIRTKIDGFQLKNMDALNVSFVFNTNELKEIHWPMNFL